MVSYGYLSSPIFRVVAITHAAAGTAPADPRIRFSISPPFKNSGSACPVE